MLLFPSSGTLPLDQWRQFLAPLLQLLQLRLQQRNPLEVLYQWHQKWYVHLLNVILFLFIIVLKDKTVCLSQFKIQGPLVLRNDAHWNVECENDYYMFNWTAFSSK